MENLQDFFKFIIAAYIFLLFIRILMMVANYIGERIGFSRFFEYLWRKIRKK